MIQNHADLRERAFPGLVVPMLGIDQHAIVVEQNVLLRLTHSPILPDHPPTDAISACPVSQCAISRLPTHSAGLSA